MGQTENTREAEAARAAGAQSVERELGAAPTTDTRAIAEAKRQQASAYAAAEADMHPSDAAAWRRARGGAGSSK